VMGRPGPRAGASGGVRHVVAGV